MILAIDPGYEQSAWLLLGDDGIPRRHGIEPNVRLRTMLRSEVWFGADEPFDPVIVAIEKVEGFGMAVGLEVFETVYWSGRFAEAAWPREVARVPRRDVKLHLCGSSRAKDPNVRQALMDRFGGSRAKGTKRAPGPLYGVSKDVWAALAVAVTLHDRGVIDDREI